MRYLAFALASVWIGSFSARAMSQPAPKNTVVAERLFDLGVADMQAGKYKTGCLLLAQSQQLDPNHGTLAAWADCEDRAGHLATAFSLYEQYLQNFASMNEAQKKRHTSRAKEAEARREKLRPLIPALRLIPPPVMPKDAKVLLDGSELDLALLALEIPVDPGEHIIVLKLINGTSSEKRVTLKSGDRLRFELEFPPLPSPPRSEPNVSDKQKPVPLEKKETTTPQHASRFRANRSSADSLPMAPASKKGSWHRTVGGISLGVGALGLGGGIMMGILSLQQQDGNCEGGSCFPSETQAWWNSTTPIDISLSAIFIGGMFTALGVGLLLWSPDNPKPPTASTRPLQLGILQASPTSFMLGAQGTIF